LESDVLDTSVLQNDVLSNLSSNDFELDTDDNQNFNLGNLYKKGTDERFIYSKQIRAFELFVSSTTGKDWFKSRVNKGFVFAPFFYKSGAFVAKENGYHYNKRIRTKLFITDIGKKLKAEGSTDIVTIAGADGLTRAKIKDNNLHVTIYLNSDNTNQSKDKIKIMYAVDTWVHEILGCISNCRFFHRYNLWLLILNASSVPKTAKRPTLKGLNMNNHRLYLWTQRHFEMHPNFITWRNF
jgi:hypothetical protein